MTSKNTNIKIHLSLTPVGEKAEIIEADGTLLEREGKSLVQFDEKRIQIEPERILIRQNYVLELRKDRETALLYPTPYGDLSMSVRTKHLEISQDRKKVDALYALYTNGEMIHKIRMNLKLEEVK